MAKLFDLKTKVSSLKSYLSDMYVDLRFLPIWVIALSVLPDFILSNLQTFLAYSVGFSVTTAAVIVNAYDGFSGIFAIVGAFVGDAYLTLHGMIFFSSLFYLSGLILLTGGCYTLNNYNEDMGIAISIWLVGAGLFLVTVGNFNLIHSAYDLSAKGNRIMSPENLVRYALKFLVTVAAFVQDSWYSPVYDDEDRFVSTPPQQFLFPAVSMLLITLVSLCYLKSSSFIKPKEYRNTLVICVPRLCITAMMKCLQCRSKDNKSLNDNRCLEKSEITESSEPVLGQAKSCCAITDVEGGKRLLGIVPMCLAFLAYGLVKSIGDTFFLDQAYDMRGGDSFPVQAFIYLAKMSSSVTIFLYEKRISDRLPQVGKKYSPAIQYAMGMVLSALCCTTASWVAMSQFQHHQHNGAVSVFRLIPQFVLFGAMDGLAGEGIEQFFSKQLHPPMRRYAIVFTDGIIGLGSAFAIILVLVTRASSNWFKQDHLRYDQFYHLLTVVGIGIFLGYTLVAVMYHYQDIEEEENQVEDQNNLIQHEMGVLVT